jgi:hypothetical protein
MGYICLYQTPETTEMQRKSIHTQQNEFYLALSKSCGLMKPPQIGDVVDEGYDGSTSDLTLLCDLITVGNSKFASDAEMVNVRHAILQAVRLDNKAISDFAYLARIRVSASPEFDNHLCELMVSEWREDATPVWDALLVNYKDSEAVFHVQSVDLRDFIADVRLYFAVEGI